jgi:hypothetical protein
MQCKISFVFLSAPLSLYLTVIFAWFRVSGLQSVTVLILYIALLSRLRMPLCLHWPNSGEQTLFDSPSQVWSGLLTCCCCWLWLLDSILSHIIVYAIVSFAAFSVAFRCQIAWWSKVYGSIWWVTIYGRTNFFIM